MNPTGDSQETVLYRAGKGNWDAFPYSLDQLLEAAAHWSKSLQGIEKPWLCWNVASDWCLAQQRLVRSVGWTPVVGFDPRAGRPPALVPGAVVVDFNFFNLPTCQPHFPLELAFQFAPRLAFWHSDLLCRPEVMRQLASLFEGLEDGQMAAVLDKGGLRDALKFKIHRFWELVGCTTRQASRDQFDKGCGWWRNFHCHPNCPGEEERQLRSTYSYEFGNGIMYWHKKYGGRVESIPQKLVLEGHFTSINNPDYVKSAQAEARKNLTVDLAANYSLQEAVAKLGLESVIFTEGS